jgi:hypothetical protein
MTHLKRQNQIPSTMHAFVIDRFEDTGKLRVLPKLKGNTDEGQPTFGGVSSS